MAFAIIWKEEQARATVLDAVSDDDVSSQEASPP
jgi:hypothetical protein